MHPFHTQLNVIPDINSSHILWIGSFFVALPRWLYVKFDYISFIFKLTTLFLCVCVWAIERQIIKWGGKNSAEINIDVFLVVKTHGENGSNRFELTPHINTRAIIPCMVKSVYKWSVACVWLCSSHVTIIGSVLYKTMLSNQISPSLSVAMAHCMRIKRSMDDHQFFY